MSITPIKEIKAILEPLLKKEAWGAELGYGSFLSIEFGDPVTLKVNASLSKVKGEWNIWLYGCAWRLEKGEELLIGSEDPREEIAPLVEILNGKKLQEVIIESPAFDAIFIFEDNIRIRTFQCYTSQDGMEGLFIYFPNNQILTIGPGAHYLFEKDSEDDSG